MVDYTHPEKKLLGNLSLPASRSDGPMEIWHPRWLYPPGGGFLNAYLLSSQLRRPLARLRKSFSFELIDAHFGYPDGIAASRLSSFFGVPFMITLRGNETMHCRDRFIRSEMANALRQAARVVTVSEELRTFAISLGADPEKVRTIPNGIDGAVFHPRDRRHCREAHGIDSAEPIILSAGSLIERKGHHHAIRALAAVRRAGVPARLLIAGGAGREGRYEDQIRKTVEECGMQAAVSFLGQVDAETLADLMAAADVLCLASSREGWPNVVHEAMGCGTPVVATAIGAVPDMIHSAEFGIIVPLNDQDALDAALLSALGRGWNRELIASWAGSRNWECVADEVLHEMQQIVH
jgi:glycosyltransferase involved in cell wall biosynthesis